MEPITIYAATATVVAATGLGLARLGLRRETVGDCELAVLIRDGAVVGELEQGLHWIVGRRATVERWDTRPQFCSTELHEVLTADRVPVKVSAEAKTVAAAPRKLRAEVDCVHGYVYRLLKLAVRDAVAAVELETLLRDRSAVNTAIESYVRERGWAAGLDVKSAQAVDVTVRADLKEAFAAKARAKAEAAAQLERARGEAAALRKLANAARVLEANEALLRLKTLQTAELAAKGTGNTLVLGLNDERATKTHGTTTDDRIGANQL